MSGSSSARAGDLTSGHVTVDFKKASNMPKLPRTATTSNDDQTPGTSYQKGVEGNVAKKSKKAEKPKKPEKQKKSVYKPPIQNKRSLMFRSLAAWFPSVSDDMPLKTSACLENRRIR
jgi:hypothetical protein